ncbi:unnamed protein product, partial [Rangifer tarandus platyrhynchus]
PPWVLPWAGFPREGKCHSAGCENIRGRDPPKSLSTVNSPEPSSLLAQGCNFPIIKLFCSQLLSVLGAPPPPPRPSS